MIEILPIRSLIDEDASIFGPLNISLAKLLRAGLPVGQGMVVTAPNLKLKTTLEHYDFKTKEVFRESLTLVKKEIEKTPVPEVLKKEVGKHSQFLVNGQKINSINKLWVSLLYIWVEEIKNRIWQQGFYPGITEGLESQVVIFIKDLKSFGKAYFDPISDDTIINIKLGKLHPNDLKKLDEIIRIANKKLFIPHEYEWILDGAVKLVKVMPYTPPIFTQPVVLASQASAHKADKPQSVVKVFLDLSSGLVIDREVDGIYIASEKIFDLNRPRDSFEDLVFRLVESATTFNQKPIFFKLADKSEGMGKIRGTLRLLHQQSLLNPMIEALDFVKHKRGILNIHVVIPFVRTVNELMQIKRELAVKKLMRKNSLEQWLEVAVPENIVNLEDYLVTGIDGVVLNLDELISHLNGFDATQEDLVFYKNEVKGLLRFLEDSLKLLHKSKIPFIAFGSLSLYPQVLDFLIEKGVTGVVVERYEAPSAHQLLHQAEKRLILGRTS